MTTFDEYTRQVFDEALMAMRRFKEVFGRSLDHGFVAELHAARELGLTIVDGMNEPGFDAADRAGTRYQIKSRSLAATSVDVNNFDFDLLVLINMDDDYQLQGMWSITAAQAQEIFV